MTEPTDDIYAALADSPASDAPPETLTATIGESLGETLAEEEALPRPSPATIPEAALGVAPQRRRAAGGLVQTVGRRKEAVVRVRVAPGTGAITCNGRPLTDYFPSKLHQQLIKSPLVLTERVESVDVFANLSGGGTSGQAGALRLAIARALCELDLDYRPALKKAGFLTRDARVIERKKYGLKKARKAPQYSKR